MDDSERTKATDAQTMKAFIRELARKNRIDQKNKDALSHIICAKFTGLRVYTAALRGGKNCVRGLAEVAGRRGDLDAAPSG